MENFPIKDTFGAFSSEKIVSYKPKFILDPKTKCNSWDIGQTNIHDDMIPPTLPEMWKDVLPGQLLELIENMPEMKNRRITNDKRSKEPVTQMNAVIVVKVIPNISPFQLAVIVISMMALCDILVKGSIKVTQKPSSIGRPMINQ